MSTNHLKHAVMSAIGASLLVATLGLAPAGAERPETVPASHGDQKPADRYERSSDHDGDADGDASTSYTEDTDTNDGGTANNVADDGDNAHPSGRDRSVEHGGGGTQGRSESDPDDDGRGPDRSNGGPDKANGAGGEDLADQDGNNGCGNDDDFEDDNEGWCGRKPKPTTPEEAASPAAKPANQAKPCAAGSMTHRCDDSAAAAGSDAEVEDDAEEQSQTADSAEHEAGAAAGATCPAADVDDDDAMSAGCDHDEATEATESDADADAAAAAAADDSETGAAGDDDNTEVLGLELTRGGAAGAEVADSTVSAQSAGGALLASLPLVGSLLEGELPMTGISTLSFLVVALAAMVIGLFLVRASRRTKAGVAS